MGQVARRRPHPTRWPPPAITPPKTATAMRLSGVGRSLVKGGMTGGGEVARSGSANGKSAPRVSFVSLGCLKALVDSERILTRLRAEGDELAPPDVVVVNTCGFLDSAKAESLLAIGRRSPIYQGPCPVYLSLIFLGCRALL